MAELEKISGLTTEQLRQLQPEVELNHAALHMSQGKYANHQAKLRKIQRQGDQISRVEASIVDKLGSTINQTNNVKKRTAKRGGGWVPFSSIKVRTKKDLQMKYGTEV